MDKVSKKFVVSLILIVVVLVAVGVWIGHGFLPPNYNGKSEYASVYLTTGDIYFGKFERWPSPHLSDVWYLERGAVQQGGQLSVNQFTKVFWGPSDELYLNNNQIIWWTYLRADSELIKGIQAAKNQP